MDLLGVCCREKGLAKPIGLVEGPGGLGQGGVAATLRTDSQETDVKYEEYGYNAQLSDRISLDRTIPDYRPKKCRQMTYSEELPQVSVVFIFVNEALSVILRSVHSVVNHTPSQLLKEVILVDDNSDNAELKFNLDQYVHRRYPGLVKIVRNSRREGLIRARLQGWKVATAPVVGFFDAHVEFNTGWAEPALSRIREDRRRVVLPAIDNIKFNTFEVQQYANAAHGYNWGLWCMYIIPPQDWLDRGDEAAPISMTWRATQRQNPVQPGERPDGLHADDAHPALRRQERKGEPQRASCVCSALQVCGDRTDRLTEAASVSTNGASLREAGVLIKAQNASRLARPPRPYVCSAIHGNGGATRVSTAALLTMAAVGSGCS
uniref:Glycosyltransferase 2-like domain-containing protein n=1 Tax=Oryctolagus cuniculus TaxID=9986 RepID=A0A5F9CC47_RABIT